MRLPFALIIVMNAQVCTCVFARAEDSSRYPISIVADMRGETDNYCGLYCVYQAGRMTGKVVDLDKLIRTERLSGQFGSTVDDLVGCCREFNIDCIPILNSTYLDTWAIGVPIIALVKNSPDAPVANHWVILLHVSIDYADVFDPSVGRMQMSRAQLLAIWGGPAIAISRYFDGSEVGFAMQALRITIISTILIAAYLLLKSLGRLSFRPLQNLILSTLAMATVAHGLDPAGFMQNSGTIGQINYAFHPRTVTPITPKDFIAHQSRYILIDTRTPLQYNSSHIPGAINLPIASSYWKNLRALEGVPYESSIILYCVSENCQWAEAMAKSPLFRRYQNVFVLENGVKGYVEAGGVLAHGRPTSVEVK